METVEFLQSTLGWAGGLWLALTQLGSDYAFIVLLSLYLWLVNPQGGRTLGVFFAISVILNSALKHTFVFQRPFQIDPSLASPAAVATAGGTGFPSGHAMVSGTLWILAALQQRSRPLLWGAVVLVALISLSRVVLGVHFLPDVIVGALLGAAIALVGARVVLPGREFVVPVLALAIAAVLPSGDHTTGLGILAGFWLSSPAFQVPRAWYAKVAFAVVGLVLVLAVYVGLSVALGDLGDITLVRALKYTVLALVATEVVPRALRFLTPSGKVAAA